MFTRPDGLPINPNYATTRFRLLVRRAGLPPVRLHDLRHGAASLAHEAGADLKTLQDLLGHSSIVVTADTYTKSRELHPVGEKLQLTRSQECRNSSPDFRTAAA